MAFILTLILIAIIIPFAYYWREKLPEIKGKVGESLVSVTLATLPRNEYKVLNDILLQSGNHTSQIDHVVVSVYGIFVIETKNCKGWIYGCTNKQYWTQNIWGRKYQLYNPIWQNESHIKSLRRILASYDCKYIPAIVFIRSSSLRIYGDADSVLWRSELNRYIKNFNVPVMDFPLCEQIADRLSLLNITDKASRKQHAINARRTAYNNHIRSILDLCPKCGGELIQKNGRYGMFYGCTNYPTCRYTRKALTNRQ